MNDMTATPTHGTPLWNLADLYPSVEAWNADGAKLAAGIKELARCQGQLGRSAERLQSCLDAHAELNKRFARLEVYASEKLSEDTSVAASLELQQRAQVLGTRLEEGAAFLKPEILQLGRARVERLVASGYRFLMPSAPRSFGVLDQGRKRAGRS